MTSKDGGTERDFILKAMGSRFACKKYLPQALEESEIEYIMECGRLSPSSFGLEPWTFCAVTDRKLLASLGEACFGQEAVSTSALAVCILVEREKSFEPGSAFLLGRAERFPGGYPVFLADYVGYYEFLRSQGRLLSWSRAQSYIAAANMMTGAKAAGIDSCAIEGYEEDEVLEILGAQPAEKAVGLIVAFGRGGEAPREKIRMPLEDLVLRL